MSVIRRTANGVAICGPSLLIAGFSGCGDPVGPPPSGVEVEIGLAVAQGVERNLTALLSRSAADRRQAFETFKRHWTDVRREVVGMMNSESVSRRLAVAYLLAELGGKDDMSALQACLSDPSSRVRAQAIQGLVRRKDERCVASLVELARSGDYEEHQMVMAALVEIDEVQAIRLVPEFLEHSEWAKRRVAVQTAGSLSDAASAQGIVTALRDPVWMVREDAVVAVLRRNLVAARDEVVRLAGSEDWPIRAAAVRCLGSFGVPEDFATIERLVATDPEKKVRIAAVESLSGYPANDSVPVAVTVLEKPSEDLKVRRAAVRMLAAHGGELGRSKLRSLLIHGDPELKVLVAEIVGAPAVQGGR